MTIDYVTRLATALSLSFLAIFFGAMLVAAGIGLLRSVRNRLCQKLPDWFELPFPGCNCPDCARARRRADTVTITRNNGRGS